MQECLTCAVRNEILHIVYNTIVTLESIQLCLNTGPCPSVFLSDGACNKIKCSSKVPVRVIKLRHKMEMNGQLHATAV